MFGNACGAPTRYREVVLTVPKQHSGLQPSFPKEMFFASLPYVSEV
jgi:hypothetical protein